MEYRTLEPNTLQALRAERLQDIEAQHFRVTLRWEETGEDTAERAAAERELADLERRWSHHSALLPDDPPAPDEKTDPPAPDETGEATCSPSTADSD